MVSKFTRKDFLEALFADYYKEHRGFILVKSLKRGDPKTSTRYFPNIEILAKEHYGEERDVYFGICPRERMKAEKEHIHYLVALWADLDIGEEGHEEKKKFFEGPQQAAKAIRSFTRAPSIIVESGRGAHLYWLLKQVEEVRDLEKVESLLAKISEHLNCDTDISLDTTLRLPETLNTKVPGKQVACEVKFINTNFRYSLQDFEDLGRRLVFAPPPQAPAPPARPSIPPPTGPAFTPPPPGAQAHVAPPAHAEVEPPMDDSLVLDETIIDELVDDMSMTSVVADFPLEEEGEIEPPEPVSAPSYVEPPVERRQPAPPVPPVVTTAGTAIAVTSSVLERLSASRADVEVSLLGSNVPVNGVLAWCQDGLIGIESDNYLYTIPISSISFIKSRVD